MTTSYVRFDASRYLHSDEAVREFLKEILESGDARVIAAGLGDVARAKGMTDLAEKSGLSRESLYRALSDNGNPRLETLMKVLAALGVKLTVAQPQPDAAE